jgi:hypothetical protein
MYMTFTCSNAWAYLLVYYKERRQLKTFLTQFVPVLPLTSDSPIRLRDDQTGGTTIEIAIWGAFLPKVNYFVTHTVFTHPRTRRAHQPPTAVCVVTVGAVAGH